MFFRYLEQMSSVYDNMDSIMIVNQDGIIEYASMKDDEGHAVTNGGYTGKKLIEVYPELTEESSTIFRVMKTGRPILDEFQSLTDCNGKTYTFTCSTYPIEMNGRIIGAVEGVVLLNPNGTPKNKKIHKREDKAKSGRRLYSLEDLISVDSRMSRIKEQILRIAPGDSPVMIVGDTGTGKEVVAQAIHSHSLRSAGPFVSQNCSAIPVGLLESTLFGTAKGSYTGAEDRKGLFELANGGTLFLDELNSMEIGLQGKILKAVEEQKIRRIGEEKEKNIDIRIVCAVNCPPDELIKTGEIRRDLYYRLSVVQIDLPPLIERKCDIPVLVDYYIGYYNQQRGKNIKGCSDLVEKILLNYTWPGNVRELRNVVEYAFNMASGEEITVRDIPESLLYDKNKEMDYSGPMYRLADIAGDDRSLGKMVEDYEKSVIEQVIREQHTLSKTAERLKISRQSLSYKLQKYGIEI